MANSSIYAAFERMWQHVVAKFVSNEYANENFATKEELENLDFEVENADWNQNDETAPDYVKNRTHYTSYEKKVLYEENDLQMIDAGYIIGSYPYLQAGQTYTITFRDEVYECVAWEHNGNIYAGSSAVIANPGIWGYDSTISADSHDNGEPFCMLTNGYTLCMDYEYKNYIKVEGLVPSYKTIDVKYLPEEATAQADWNQNNEAASDYIKNRPFYENIGDNTLVDNLTTADYSSGNKPSCNFVVGRAYTVVWNGIAYDVVCQDSSGYNALISDEDGHLFYIDDVGGNDLYISSQESEDYTVSIYEHVDILKTIDTKYLPEYLHLVESIVREPLLAEMEITLSDNMYQYDDPIAPLLDVGTTCIVNWNGTEYKCEVWDNDNSSNERYLGNPAILNEGEDTGEPFYIYIYLTQGYKIYGTGDPSTLTVSIDIGVPGAGTIDSKYIPPTYFILEANKGLEQKFWRGTKEEFDAVETKDENTMYIITDDNGKDESGTPIYIGENEPADELLWVDTKDETADIEIENAVVTSFNGRGGNVVPESGDYTAEMVGARPDDWMPTAEMVGAQPKITGIAGQFVVIGEDGNVTTKTIANAEEASF